MRSLRDTSFFCFCIFFGVTLFVAAGSKVATLEENAGRSIRIAIWMISIIEFALGLLLVVGIHRAVAWVASLSLCSAFCGASLVGVYLQNRSCGCFGAIEVSPTSILVLDVMLTCWLVMCRPNSSIPSTLPMQAIVIAVFGMLGAAGVHFFPKAILAPGVSQTAQGLQLNPKEWVGGQLPIPIAGTLDSPELLNRGRWRVLIYSASCPHCQEALAHGPSRWRADDPVRQIGLISIDQRVSAATDANVHYFSISDGARWLVRVPTLVDIDAGIVRHVE